MESGFSTALSIVFPADEIKETGRALRRTQRETDREVHRLQLLERKLFEDMKKAWKVTSNVQTIRGLAVDVVRLRRYSLKLL